MASAAVTSKGQITIPKAVREALRLLPGDRVSFAVRDDGTAVVTPENVDIASLRGVVKPTVRGVTIERMNEVIRRGGSRR